MKTHHESHTMTGQISYLKGQAAEARVVDVYLTHGHRILARRWRGPSGEIDLIFERSGEVVFVEVKSSRTHGQALANLRPHQIRRLVASAEAGLGFFHKGSLTPMRFDVATVDGMGRIDVIQNALEAA